MIMIFTSTSPAGINNKLEPPDQSDRNADKIPRTLDEALSELLADTTMVQALGEEFVEWLVGIIPVYYY